jgi:transmembrane sensor
LEDEEFIRAVNADKHFAEGYLTALFRENPDKEEIIRDAADFVRHYQLKQVVDRETIDEMWRSVLKSSGAGKAHSRFRSVTLLKIVASVAIVVSLGFYIFYLSQENRLRKFAEQQVEMDDEAKIIISNGTEYKLKENESNVRYNVDGKEIVIEEKDHRTETLTNYSENTKTAFNQIIVPYGRRHSLTLSDGTKVQLNAGSNLVFPSKFSGNRREGYLKGEGYFCVTKNKNMPFIVTTDYVNIKVLGTRFNITAYENENSASAVLVEGSVEVYTNKFLRKDHCKITPGQGYFYSKENSDSSVRDVDVDEYISWTKGVLQFRGQTFASIISRIKKFYNVSIIIKDDELAKRLITGKLVLYDDIEKIMAFMASTTKSRYFTDQGSYIFFAKKTLKQSNS